LPKRLEHEWTNPSFRSPAPAPAAQARSAERARRRQLPAGRGVRRVLLLRGGDHSSDQSALDPFGKIPEFKYCAVKVVPGGQVGQQGSYGGGQMLRALERTPG